MSLFFTSPGHNGNCCGFEQQHNGNQAERPKHSFRMIFGVEFSYRKWKELFLIYAISWHHNLQAARKELKPDKPRKIEKAH